MCGIAGIVGLGADEQGSAVLAMTQALRHRGPDALGTLALGHTQLGATRLRILDLSSGDQPLVSAETGAALVFNGEIYNHRELRSRLEALGHRFRTATDTEVVLRAYEAYGWRCVERLEGMYALAIAHGATVLLARDPLGIKPLHLCWLRGAEILAFASEVKALLRCPQVPARLSEASLGDLAVFRYIADPRATLFEGIESLEPGTCLEITTTSTGLQARRHAPTRTRAVPDPAPSLEDAEHELDQRVGAAVRSHLVADVPICLTLSGGLDSTFLALYLRGHPGATLASYVAGDDPDQPDLRQAARMAEALGLDHRPVLLSFEDYLAALPGSILASEGLEDGVPQYVLFREMGRDFRVCLNGEGADELFGGYPEHWEAARHVDRIRESSDGLPLTERGARARDHLRSDPRLDADAWMYEHLLGPQLTDRHLHPLDKLGMSSSVEVRVPYLDEALVTYARGLPPAWRLERALGSAKYLLRLAFLRRWRLAGGAPALLDAVLREKRGFPDARRASGRRFRALCEHAVSDAAFEAHPRRRLLSHKTDAVWLDLFEHLFCERRGVLAPGFDLRGFLAERWGRPGSQAGAAPAGASSPTARPAAPAPAREPALVLEAGGAPVPVFVERAKAGRAYYATVGELGIYHEAATPSMEVARAMDAVVAVVRGLVDARAEVDPHQIARALGAAPGLEVVPSADLG